MIDLSLPIKPGVSCGGILIGDNIANYMSNLYQQFADVQVVEYKNTKHPVTSYIINKGVLRINTSEAGDILSIGCSKGYKGLCKGIYGPGITVEHLLKVSSQQNLLHGAIILDRDFGFYFPIPYPHDELADSIQDLPLQLRLDVLHVENVAWWINPQLTPAYAK